MACTNHNRKKVARKWMTSGGLISGLVIALLPKCPFCIMAYAGAIAMCNGNKIYPYDGSSAAIIGLILSVWVLASIALNNRGRRTKCALVIAVLGISLLGLAQSILMDEILYYFGASILLFAVWLNGSFMYFASRVYVFMKSIQLRNN